MIDSIFINHFKSVFTLEHFLAEINYKPPIGKVDLYKKVISKLSPLLIITFDIELNGPFKSYIDDRYSYEQLLYMCYVRANDPKLAFIYEKHTFKYEKTNYFSLYKNNMLEFHQKLNMELFNSSPEVLKRKLLATENLAICYFLSESPHDGIVWRQLHSLVGSSILKYIFLYSFVFRRLDKSEVTYVQVCGKMFNYFHKKLSESHLELEEAKYFKVKTAEPLNLDDNKPAIENLKKTPLNVPFKQEDERLLKEFADRKSATYQIKQFGNQNLDIKRIHYDRNFHSHLGKYLLYTNRKLESIDVIATKIIDEFILNKIDLDLYIKENVSGNDDIKQMKDILTAAIVNFIQNYRKCPFDFFYKLNIQKSDKKLVKTKQNDEKKQETNRNSKRKRDKDDATSIPSETRNLLEINIPPKGVYCFIRRCAMFCLDYTHKIDKELRLDKTAPLIGGKVNFDQFIKKLYPMLKGLKYDTHRLSNLLHDIKFARISYLQPIKCIKFKRLVLLAVVRWIFEDFFFKLIKARFYVTDTAKTNSAIFYYTKKDWANIVQFQLSDPETKNYQKIYNLEKIKVT
jgi:hypothetical protein